MRLSDGCLVPLGARADAGLIWPIVRRDSSPQSDPNGSPTSTSVGVWGTGGWGPRPRLAAAAPNLRRDLVLGFPASL